jgi:hypothetical protein
VATSNGRRPLYGHVDDKTTDRNFAETSRMFLELWPGVWGHQVSLALTTGDNAITPPIKHPTGRVIVYQDSAAVVFDKGLQDNGTWIFNASAPVNLRVVFF